MYFTSGTRWTDVHLAAAARGIAACGEYLAATALVLELQRRGAGGLAVATLLVAAAVPPVVLARWTGRLADRVDSRMLLTCTAVVQAVVCLALTTVTSTAGIIALVTVLAAGLAVIQPTLMALVPAMAAPADLARAAAVGQTASALGLLAGPPLGGVLLGLGGLRPPLLVDAAGYACLAVVALCIRTRRGRPGTGGEPTRPWRLRTDPLLAVVFLLIGAVLVAVAGVNVGTVFLVRGPLHGSAADYGYLEAIWSAAAIGGAWLVTRWARGDRTQTRWLLAGLAFDCLCIVLIAAAPNLRTAAGLYVVGGLGNGIINVVPAVLIGRRVDPAARGRAFALYAAMANGTSAIGYVMGGVLLAALPVRVALAAEGAAALAACLALTPYTLTRTATVPEQA